MVTVCPPAVQRLAQRAGFINDRNLFWACRVERNFGDWLAPYIFKYLSQSEPVFCKPQSLWIGEVYFTIGSIFHHIKKSDVAIVWGSGIINRNIDFKRPKRIHAVRGPLTRRRCHALGVHCPPIYGDPAILMPLFYSPGRRTRKKIGIIPHFVDFASCEAIFRDVPDLRLIDVLRHPEQVIDDIVSCERIASSSLHGLIIAHAYGIPAVRLVVSENIKGDGVKFEDYRLSLGNSFPLRTIACKGEWDTEHVIQATLEESAIPCFRKMQMSLLDCCPFSKTSIFLSLMILFI